MWGGVCMCVWGSSCGCREVTGSQHQLWKWHKKLTWLLGTLRLLWRMGDTLCGSVVRTASSFQHRLDFHNRICHSTEGKNWTVGQACFLETILDWTFVFSHFVIHSSSFGASRSCVGSFTALYGRSYLWSLGDGSLFDVKETRTYRSVRCRWVRGPLIIMLLRSV